MASQLRIILHIWRTTTRTHNGNFFIEISTVFRRTMYILYIHQLPECVQTFSVWVEISSSPEILHTKLLLKCFIISERNIFARIFGPPYTRINHHSNEVLIQLVLMRNRFRNSDWAFVWKIIFIQKRLFEPHVHKIPLYIFVCSILVGTFCLCRPSTILVDCRQHPQLLWIPTQTHITISS